MMLDTPVINGRKCEKQRALVKITCLRDSRMGLWILEANYGPDDEPDNNESAEHVEDDLPAECVCERATQEHAADRTKLST